MGHSDHTVGQSKAVIKGPRGPPAYIHHICTCGGSHDPLSEKLHCNDHMQIACNIQHFVIKLSLRSEMSSTPLNTVMIVYFFFFLSVRHAFYKEPYKVSLQAINLNLLFCRLAGIISLQFITTLNIWVNDI